MGPVDACVSQRKVRALERDCERADSKIYVQFRSFLVGRGGNVHLGARGGREQEAPVIKEHRT